MMEPLDKHNVKATFFMTGGFVSDNPECVKTLVEKAVSYTHLDVYKRQSKDRSLRKQVFRGVYDSYKKWSNTVSMMYISKLKNDTFYARVRKYDSARAVSYTHLDVYKRQVSGLGL